MPSLTIEVQPLCLILNIVWLKYTKGDLLFNIYTHISFINFISFFLTRHFQCCSQYHAKQALTGFLDEECCMETVSDTSGTKFSTIKFSELEFNVFNNHLFTYCADCSFSEQIT